jgi:predicted TIM-barrel fold metal-dependent hydrolase
MASTASVSLAHHAHVFPPAVKAEGSLDSLLRYLDAADIAEAVCFPPFAEQVPTQGRTHNDWLAAELKGQSRLHGFGTLDFSRDDLVQQVRHVAELGFKGIKIHPPSQKLNILSPKAWEVYGAAEQANLFLTFHTGIHHQRLRDARVIDWDDLCRSFPKLRFSMEHMGGWSFFNEAVAVIANNTPPPWEKGRCHVFAGLTSIFSQQTLPCCFMPKDRLEEFVLQAHVSQIIFGLDFPYTDVTAAKRGIDTIRSLGLSPEDTAMILGGNLKRELGL